MHPRRPSFLTLAALAAMLLPSACKKVIGDACTANTDCSVSADRICDLSQTSGYCTVPGCEPGSCPDNGVCVFFDAHAPRLRRRYCMAGCNGDSDCRSDYRCVRPDPVACIQSTTEVLPAGQTCNRIGDTSPSYAGWCVQAR